MTFDGFISDAFDSTAMVLSVLLEEQYLAYQLAFYASFYHRKNVNSVLNGFVKLAG